MFVRMLLVVLIFWTGSAQPQTDPRRKPDASEQSAALAAIRTYALNYTQRLPNYVCTQLTRRITWPDSVTDGPQIQHEDVFESQVGLVDRREIEKITTINGKPATSAGFRSLAGVFSRGEFNELLVRIFDPQALTQFQWDRWVTRDGRRMKRFFLSRAAVQWLRH